MKTRIITAAIAIPLLLIILLVAPEIVAALVFGALMAVGAYEFLYRTGLIRRIRLVVYSAVMAFAMSIWSYYGGLQAYLMIGSVIFFMLLFSEIMMDHVKVSIESIGLCTLGGYLIPLLLSSLIRILGGENGRYFILLPFTIAFLSDAGAYFTGLRLGRHKLAPVVSPNKTIEGVLGGGVFALAGVLIYALMLDLALKFRETTVQPFSMHSWDPASGSWAICVSPWSSGRPASRTMAICSPATAAFWTGSIPWFLLHLLWKRCF